MSGRESKRDNGGGGMLRRRHFIHDCVSAVSEWPTQRVLLGLTWPLLSLPGYHAQNNLSPSAGFHGNFEIFAGPDVRSHLASCSSSSATHSDSHAPDEAVVGRQCLNLALFAAAAFFGVGGVSMLCTS